MSSSSAKQATSDEELENDLFGFELVDSAAVVLPVLPQADLRFYAVFALGRRANQLSPELL